MDLLDAERLSSVRSREELRFEFVDEQGWDASCGYAALASLLGRYRGVSVNEEALLGRSVAGGGETVLTVSLAELLRLARGLGLTTTAWRASFDGLPQLLQRSTPLLVHYDRPQGHFALVLQVGADGVVTADPARGLELLTRNQFLGRWSGVVAEISDPKDPRRSDALVENVVRVVLGRAALMERALSHPPPMR